MIHAAGVLDDGLIGDQTWERFESVLAPKVIGATLLHEYTRTLPLDFFILYSSAASVLGSPGQSNYATANAYLDGLAWQRRAMGLPATSINWGPWTEGMADDERILKRLALQGITPLTVGEAHSAMELLLRNETTQATVIDADWRRMLMGGESTLLSELKVTRQKSSAADSELVGKLRKLRGAAQKQLLVQTLQGTLQTILSTPDLPETDRPLIEMGLDSLMAVEFGSELQILLGDGFSINPTMLFDHPTVDAIADHVLELLAGASEEAEEETQPSTAPSPESNVETQRDDVAIIGMSCRFPGARNIEEFWQNLLDRVDSVCEIPEDRWDVERFFDADREPGKMYTREGGFLRDIADFDADFFNVSAAEACWIDPQHRMLLENSYRALEDAGIPTQPLQDANVGVFMGIMGQDYAFLPSLDDEEIIRNFQGAGLSHSAGVGRISYMFGFEGPSVAVDTASSSSLVALHQATRSLQDGNCNMALAGGVNAILAPVNSLLMSKAALLSPDGRCKSFSAGANGFGRGEGCGVVVLKRLSDAQRDGDRIMAVVRGGAVVHNGFSGGITSPSGKSQARVIGEALKDARVAPSQVQYLEAHGTGTEFGDPMELSAAASVYGKGRKRDEQLLVGSVKANISHLEAAGGISGLIKTVLALHHGKIPAQIHFDEPSKHIPWKRLPVKMVTEETLWPESQERFAGVTALGLVGTNAHIVLSGAPDYKADPPQEASSERTAHLAVLSARNPAALSALAESFKHYLLRQPDVDLADLCHTLSAGRRHHEHRLAITVETTQELASALAGYSVNGPVSSTVQTDSFAKNGHSSSNGTGTMHTDRARLSTNIAKPQASVAWVFSGNRVADFSPIHELYQQQPLVRQLVAEFDQRLAARANSHRGARPSLQDWFTGGVDQTDEIHVFAAQSALAKLWQAWGIDADVVAGIGVGQYSAACVAGGLCFFDAITLVAARSDVLRSHQNGEHEALESQLAQFEQYADTINYYPPNLPLLCSLSAETVPVHRSLGGSYWRQHILAEPKTSETFDLLAEKRCDFTLLLGPDSEELPVQHSLASLQANQSTTTSMLEVLGKLYVGGATPDFKAFDAHWPRRKLSLPPYPFQRKTVLDH